MVELEKGEARNKLEAKQVEQALLYSTNSTALDYTHKIAQDQSLHEVEFVSPQTLIDLKFDTNNHFCIPKHTQVFFCGYVFTKKEAETDPVISKWKAAFECLQFGGERSYGGGLTRLSAELLFNTRFFNYDLQLDQARPTISLTPCRSILAHSPVNDSLISYGELEAVLGREINSANTRFGDKINSAFTATGNPVCYVPGSQTRLKQVFQIGAMSGWFSL